ncbi:hypothetical protein P5673_000385 [Acropora cervicornis]|uniref:Uncharacterized protein n=1 Tax=Acropora cervicornis TaxID=6130 RepID=A0AAD9R712_ACRCE|nr:hypothetical protein P5673_000385 [Acropora cervicornis]
MRGLLVVRHLDAPSGDIKRRGELDNCKWLEGRLCEGKAADEVMTGSGEIVFFVSCSVLSSKVVGFVASNTLAQQTVINTSANSPDVSYLEDRKTLLIKLIPRLRPGTGNLWVQFTSFTN